jgi:chromosome segregation ATPase
MQQTDDELEELRSVNTQAKHDLDRLSEDLDKLLRRRNHKKKKTTDAESKLHMPAELRLALKVNEDLRKDRIKLTAEIHHSDTASRIAEVRDTMRVVDVKIEDMKTEIKAMENVNKGREGVLEEAKNNESELKFLRDAHRQELNGFRDEWHELNEERKHIDKNSIAVQVKLHRIQEKVKLKVDGDAYAKLQQRAEEQQTTIDGLTGETDSREMDVTADQKRDRAEARRLRTERDELNFRVADLKQRQVERERELRLSYTADVAAGSTLTKRPAAL